MERTIAPSPQQLLIRLLLFELVARFFKAVKAKKKNNQVEEMS